MNTQDNQGNGWVGGSIGTGLGAVGGLLTAPKVSNAVKDGISGRKRYDERIDKLYNQEVGRLGFTPERQSGFGRPYVKAVNKIDDLQRQALLKAKPYATAAFFLHLLGVPVTAGLLGASLTD